MARSWWQTSNTDGGQDPNAWWDQPGFFGGMATTQTPSKNVAVKAVEGAGDIVKGVGSFFGGMIKDIGHDAAQTVKTVKNIGEATYHAVTDPGKLKDMDERQKKNNDDYEAGRISLAEYNQQAKSILDERAKFGEELANLGINKDKTSSLSQGSAAANTFLNFATLGVGGGVKAALKQGGKEVIKEGFEQGAKQGVKATAKVLATKGAKEEAAQRALADTVLEGGPQAGRAALQATGREVVGGSAIGAGQGALSTFDGTNPDSSPQDVWKNALTGGLFGAGGGVLGSLGNREIRVGLRDAPGAIKEDVGNAATKFTDALRSPMPLGEGGYVRNPFYKAPEVTDRPGNAVNPADVPSRDLTPQEQQQHDMAQEIAQHYASADDYLKQTAKQAWNYEKGQRGGELTRISSPNGPDTFSRSTSHTPFYSQYFSENGKAPTQAAFRDEVQRALESGTDGGGLIDPGESEVYRILKERDSSNQSLLEDPSASYEVQRQRHMAALAGDDSALQIETAPAPEIPKKANERAYLKSLQGDTNSAPEFKQALSEVNPQTYETRAQQPLVDNAKSMIETDSEGATRDILSKDTLSDQDVITAYQLMGKLNKEGRTQDAVNLAIHTDEKLRDAGRTVKAADVVGNLSPEGVLTYAARKIRKASEKISAGRGFQKGDSGARKLAGEIQSNIETAGNVSTDEVRKAVREIAGGKNIPLPPAKPGEGQLDFNGNPLKGADAELTTGEKIAKKVEAAADPKVKKKADTLVNEISKKVKQEMMAKKTVNQKSALDIMRDVFARNKEAQEAFPEAQRILMEKAKDNPKIQAALQQFFDSELGMPASSSTIDNAIREQMKKNDVKIADVIQKSWNAQEQSVGDITNALVSEGFDEQSAKAIATEVRSRLNERVSVAKKKVLARLAQDAPKSARKTYLDKVNKLANLGALSDPDYIELARTKMKLPTLSEDMGQEIAALSQKMQDLPEGVEKDQVAREIYEKINSAIPRNWKDKAADIISAPKSIMSSYDLSGTLRQGGVLGARFRTEAKDAFTKQLKYFGSQQKFDEGMSAIKQDPLFPQAIRANLALTGTEGAEEAFVSKLPEKIPLFGKGITASDRAYTGALTELRFNSFKHIMNDLTEAGIDVSAMSDEQLKSIGKFINTASGRGYGTPGGLFEKMAPALNRTLFSPRLWKSRLDMLNPAYYYKLDPIARKYALESAGSFAAITGTIMGLAALAGAKVETDPRSSDFLKVRVGDTRYDILGGFQQNLVFAARMLSGEKKSSTTGDITDLTSGDFGAPTRFSVLSDLIDNKANPAISTAVDLLKGTDPSGQKINPASEIAQLVVPLNLQGTYELGKQTDPLTALFMSGIPGTLGVGVNTYGDNSTSGTGQYEGFNASLRGL